MAVRIEEREFKALMNLFTEIVSSSQELTNKFGDRLGDLLLRAFPAMGPRPIDLDLESPASPSRSDRGPPATPYRDITSPTPSQPDIMFSAHSSDAESDDDVDFSHDSSDGYELVQGKRKKKRSSGQASKAKKVTEGPKQGNRTPPASPASQSARPSSPMATEQAASGRKTKPPPPLFLHDKAKWTDISKECNALNINYTSARAVAQGIKIQVPTSTDFRSLTKLLQKGNTPYHTYSIQEEKPIRVVITNVPLEIPTSELKQDLESQGVPVTHVHRMHRRGGNPYNMVLVVCEPTERRHPIFQISKICGLSGIGIEKPRKSGIVGQCHRCQLYGHSQTNCFGKPRCVKCLGDHGTDDCTRPKDRTLCTEPPSCVLCGEQGHTANYRGCKKAPKSSAPRLEKRSKARQLRECPTLSAELPSSLSPQRPSPWTALNHQTHFPALRPATQAAAATTVSPTPAPAPARTASASPPPPATPFTQHNVIASTLGVFYTERALQFNQAIIATRGDLVLLSSVLAEYDDVAQSVLNLPHFRA